MAERLVACRGFIAVDVLKTVSCIACERETTRGRFMCEAVETRCSMVIRAGGARHHQITSLQGGYKISGRNMSWGLPIMHHIRKYLGSCVP
mmetsp:Transcript_8978/g.19233  ORF Transcript_8978/g.19233 Transcript_8978/m.19233 type:complete len:91 (+) Transcript_8978:1796-2068(+)